MRLTKQEILELDSHVYQWSISDKEFFHDNQALFDIYASKVVLE